MNAKPVRNKYTINANLRMKEFEENAKIKDFFSSIIPDIKK